MYLEDIITAMDRIAEYIEGYSFLEFKKVDAVIRNFEIIRETSKNLPDEPKKYPSYFQLPHILSRNFDIFTLNFRH